MKLNIQDFFFRCCYCCCCYDNNRTFSKTSTKLCIFHFFLWISSTNWSQTEYKYGKLFDVLKSQRGFPLFTNENSYANFTNWMQLVYSIFIVYFSFFFIHISINVAFSFWLGNARHISRNVNHQNFDKFDFMQTSMFLIQTYFYHLILPFFLLKIFVFPKKNNSTECSTWCWLHCIHMLLCVFPVLWILPGRIIETWLLQWNQSHSIATHTHTQPRTNKCCLSFVFFAPLKSNGFHYNKRIVFIFFFSYWIHSL